MVFSILERFKRQTDSVQYTVAQMKNCVKKCVKKTFSAWFMHKVATRECFSRNRLAAAEVAAAIATACGFKLCIEWVLFIRYRSSLFFSSNPFFLLPLLFDRAKWNKHLSTHPRTLWCAKFRLIKGLKVQKKSRKIQTDESNQDIWMNVVSIVRLSCKIYRYNSISLHRRVYIEGVVIFFSFLLYNMPT